MRADEKFVRNVISPEKLEALANADSDLDSETVLDRQPLVSRRMISGAMRVYEILLIALIGTVIWTVYVSSLTPESILLYIPIIAFVSLAVPLALEMADLYEVHSLLTYTPQIPRVAAVWLMVLSLIFAILFFSKAGGNFSRVWLGTLAVGGLAAIIASRVIIAALVRSWNKSGQLDRRAVLVGGGETAEKLIHAINSSPDHDVSIIGIFDDRDDERSPTQVANLRKLGNVDKLVEYTRQTRVDLLIITLPLVAETRLLQIMKKLWVLPVDIRLSAYTQKLRYRPRAYSYIGNVPLLDVFDRPLSGWNEIVKMFEDKIIASIALILLSPIMLATAIAVKLTSKGPVFFKQKRYGFNNELIEVYKFRSMYSDVCDPDAKILVTRNDSRVTPVGRFIRKTSIDELPQLINVLKGELSLVGPRPHPLQAKARDQLYHDVVDGYFARHKVKPGITGWAQINGWRGETDTEEKIERRVEHDLFYIENWSLSFDLYILLKTPFSMLETENAY